MRAAGRPSGFSSHPMQQAAAQVVSVPQERQGLAGGVAPLVCPSSRLASPCERAALPLSPCKQLCLSSSDEWGDFDNPLYASHMRFLDRAALVAFLTFTAVMLAPNASGQADPRLIGGVGPYDERFPAPHAVGASVSTGGADPLWSDAFAGPPGTDDMVFAAAASGSDLYVGGRFRSVDGGRTAAGAIARWDGTSWHTVGGGLFDPASCPYSNCGEVYELEVAGGLLYVGGEFGPLSVNSPGGFPFSNLATWDGEAWQDLSGGVAMEPGSNFSASVSALTPSPEGVYVGGSFDRAGGQSASNVALWDGTAWNPLGGGLPFGVEDIAVSGSRVVAVGWLNRDRYVGLSVAEWDGSAWTVIVMDQAEYGGVQGRVDAVTFLDGEVYIGGYFRSVADVPAESVARWDGTAWHPVGGGVDSNVWSLVARSGRLVAGGLFRTAGGQPANRVAEWDGTAWRSLGGGVERNDDDFNGRIDVLAVTPGGVVAGGSFEAAGGVSAGNVAEWNGDRWNALGSGHIGGLSAGATVAVRGPDGLYAGGQFLNAGAHRAGAVARWDGETWHALGAGTGGSVFALAVEATAGPTRVYAGGSRFRLRTGIIDAAAVWDGAMWQPLVDPEVQVDIIRALALFQGQLYATGVFNDLTAGVTRRFVRWTGAKWEPVPGTGGGLLGVAALHVSGDRLVIAGDFTEVGGTPASRVARWDGVAWSAVGTPLTGRVGHVEEVAGSLVIGGVFGIGATGTLVAQVARWTGTAWARIGSAFGSTTFSASLADMVTDADTVYAMGTFQNGQTLARSIRFGSWTTIDGLPYGSGVGLLAGGGDLYVVGRFAQAGGHGSSRIAHWRSGGFSPTTGETVPGGPTALRSRVAPNPVVSDSGTRLLVELPEAAFARVAVYDALGREISVLYDGHMDAGASELSLDTSGWAPGVYVVRIEASGRVSTSRLVVAR